MPDEVSHKPISLDDVVKAIQEKTPDPPIPVFDHQLALWSDGSLRWLAPGIPDAKLIRLAPGDSACFNADGRRIYTMNYHGFTESVEGGATVIEHMDASETLAFIRKPYMCFDPVTGEPELRFGMEVNPYLQRQAVLRGEQITDIIKAAYVRQVEELDGSLCWVSRNGADIKYLRFACRITADDYE